MCVGRTLSNDTDRDTDIFSEQQMGPKGCQTVITAIFQLVCFSLSDWISAYSSFQTLLHIPNIAFQFLQININASLTITQLSGAIHTHSVKLGRSQNANALIATAPCRYMAHIVLYIIQALNVSQQLPINTNINT